LEIFNLQFVIVPFGISPTVVEVKARNYAFSEYPYAIRSWPFKNFKDQFAQYKIAQYTDRGVKSQSYAGMLLTSEEAERCDATTFNPKKGQIYESKFNNRFFDLYRGLQVQAKEGHWSKIRDMILNNLCNSSEESLEYFLKWSALTVQKPWIKCVTALVFNGPQGFGKGTFANTLMGSFFWKRFTLQPHCERRAFMWKVQ
jgi:hypothetical protein